MLNRDLSRGLPAYICSVMSCKVLGRWSDKVAGNRRVMAGYGTYCRPPHLMLFFRTASGSCLLTTKFAGMATNMHSLTATVNSVENKTLLVDYTVGIMDI